MVKFFILFNLSIGDPVLDLPLALHVPIHSERDRDVHPDSQGSDHQQETLVDASRQHVHRQLPSNLRAQVSQ